MAREFCGLCVEFDADRAGKSWGLGEGASDLRAEDRLPRLHAGAESRLRRAQLAQSMEVPAGGRCLVVSTRRSQTPSASRPIMGGPAASSAAAFAFRAE
jgi:hypothetical protein